MQERTERATPKRRERARDRGESPRSALASVAAAAWFAPLPFLAAPNFVASWIAALAQSADIGARAAHAAHTENSAPAGAIAAAFGAPALWWPVAAAGACALLAAVAGAGACGSLGWSPKALAWNAARLSPAAGMRTLFSRDALVQTAVALATACGVLASDLPAARTLIEAAAAGGSLADAVTSTSTALASFWWRAALSLTAAAAIDVVLARRRFEARIRMTPREVRDERFEQEGRPEVKSRRRSLALRARRRLRAGAIKRAAAVVTNPTRVAVALEYAPPQIDVPRVNAAAAGAGAAFIRAIAAFHDVPVIESPELARGLFARVEVDEPIPEELYAAVAAVFAWILKTRGRLGGTPET